MKKIFKITLFFIIWLLVLPIFIFGQNSNQSTTSLAESETNNLKEICQIEKVEEQCENISPTECRNLLEKCEQYYQQEETRIGEDISELQKEKNTRQNQINLYKAKINQLELQINQGNLMIKDLSYQLSDTQSSIEKTSLKIESSKEKLVSFLRDIYEEDQKSLIEILLSENSLSGFFDNLMALEILNLKTQELLEEIKNLKSQLESQKESLEREKLNLEKVVQNQSKQKQQSEILKKEQEKLLRMTEAQYQQLLKEREETKKAAAEIRARLFRLIGIPDIKAPTFGEVLEIAKTVTKVVNIRPAFLLGIISTESALGRNVGQCRITNKETGAGVCITDVKGLCKAGDPINRIIHPTRDLPIFLRMTGENFSQFPVSCWIKICAKEKYPNRYQFVYNNITLDSAGNIICPSGYQPFGFGGAMGPAQFLPSTWQKYEGKITEKFGITSPNPWRVFDSFAAAALYLYDLGARPNQNETLAARRYSGGYSWYAFDVMKRTNCIQDFIDKGTMSTECEKLIF